MGEAEDEDQLKEQRGRRMLLRFSSSHTGIFYIDSYGNWMHVLLQQLLASLKKKINK